MWARYNGEALVPGDKDYDEVLYVAGDVHYWIGLPFKLSDPGVNLHDRGVDDQGRQVVGVSFGEGVGLHDGDSWQYWFEKDRTWPVQVAYKEENRTNWNLLRFEDVRDRERIYLRRTPRPLQRRGPAHKGAPHARFRVQSGAGHGGIRRAAVGFAGETSSVRSRSLAGIAIVSTQPAASMALSASTVDFTCSALVASAACSSSPSSTSRIRSSPFSPSMHGTPR